MRPYGHDNSGYGAIVVCNRAAVAKCPTSIDEFFDVEAFPGKRMLPGDAAFFHALSAVLALAVPPLFLHVDWQPGVSVGVGSTSIGVEVSDLAVLAIVISVVMWSLRRRMARRSR